MFIDFETDHLYWTENIEQGVFVGLIKRVDLNTKRAETVLRMQGTPLTGATMINNNIYFTDMQDGRLYRKDGATNGTFLLTTAKNSFLLSSQSQPQLLDNPCEVDNGGCSDFCLMDNVARYRFSLVVTNPLSVSMLHLLAMD